MTPKLPTNPSTISKPKLTLLEELRRLSALDTYYRQTDPEREERKQEIKRLINEKYGLINEKYEDRR